MAKHQVEYDDQGVATNEPWTLDDYLGADGYYWPEDTRGIKESVLSWLREYQTAGGMTLADVIADLAKDEET